MPHLSARNVFLTQIRSLCTLLSTNSPAYPTAWRNITAEPIFLYESAEDCCKHYYGYFQIPMDACGMEDLCPDGKSVSVAADELITSTPGPTPSPSKGPTTEPTRSPTHSPSDVPTRNPTRSPTRSPSDSPTSNPTKSSVASSDDGKWFPDTVNGVATCRHGSDSDYPPSYETYGWIFEDDVNEEGAVIKSGEQKCCEKWSLSCNSKFKEAHWYPKYDSLTDKRVCVNDNNYSSSYTFEGGWLFMSEEDCCEHHGLSHCSPISEAWFPRISELGVKECAFGVPPSTFQFASRDDCCYEFPEACPTPPPTPAPRPSIETPPCEETADGKECAWWPAWIENEEGTKLLTCRFSSSWPDIAADTLTPDDNGNGFYACCDTYACAKNADGSYVSAMEEQSNSATNGPTPSPSKGPTNEPTRLPTHSPSDVPTRNPTKSPTRSPSDSPTSDPTSLPTHSPSDNPTRNPTKPPTRSPSDSPTNRPSDKPVSDVICTNVFAPVCGVDGVSYSNDCEANKVGVTIAYSGECEVPAEKCSPGSSCATEGSSCSMGTETCCGQTYDSLKCNCSDGIWMCHIAEACMLPCAPTFSPTKRTRQPTPLPSQNPTRTPTSQPAAATTTTTTTVAATTTTTTEGMVTHSSGLCGKWHVSREAPGTWYVNVIVSMQTMHHTFLLTFPSFV